MVNRLRVCCGRSMTETVARSEDAGESRTPRHRARGAIHTWKPPSERPCQHPSGFLIDHRPSDYGPETVRALSASYCRSYGVRFLFSSIVNLATGIVVGVEMLPRPRYPGFADVMAAASSGNQRTAFDAGMAAAGLRWSVDAGVRLPVHLNLRTETVCTTDDILDELHAAVAELGADPAQLVIEIPTPTTQLDARLLGFKRLHEQGYRLLIDQVNADEMSRTLIMQVQPDQVKLRPDLFAGLSSGLNIAMPPHTRAIANLVRFCHDQGTEVVADGITTRAELDELRACGVRCGQGPLLAAPSRRPLTQINLAAPDQASEAARGSVSARAVLDLSTGARIGRYARAATVLADDVNGDQVREIFRDAPIINGVVLVDSARRPVATLDRNRFMLALSGPYGHALHAKRPAHTLADSPRVLAAEADLRAATPLLTQGDPQRRYDDIVLTDTQGRCIGIAHITDVLRGLMDLESQRARALHPTTGFAGVEALGTFLERRLIEETDFAAGWLVPELGPSIQKGGFSNAEAALRRLAHAVAIAASRAPGTEITHVLDGLVVLTQLDQVAALDSAARQMLARHGGPGLYSAWLSCQPSQTSGRAEVEAHLARLLQRARTT